MISKNNGNPNWGIDITNVKFPLPNAATSIAYKKNFYDGINTKNDESNTTSTNTTYENRIELSDNNSPVIKTEQLNNNSLHPIDSTPSVKFKIDDRLSPTDVLPKTHLSISRDENISNITNIKRTGSMPSFSATKGLGNGAKPTALSASNQSRHKRRHTMVSNLTETPIQYLERMRYTLSKLELITLLAKSKDVFHEAVLRTYMDLFDFRGDPIDLALRKFLMDCCLPKETQQIDRMMEAFAKQYHECNPALFPSQDTAYFLAFSLLMLHTDAFNESVKRKMTKEEFKKNARIDGVASEILDILYDNITFAQFIYADDDTDVDGTQMFATPSDLIQSKAKRVERSKNNPYYVIQNKVPTEFTPCIKDTVPKENPYSYKGTLPDLDIDYLRKGFTSARTIRITGIPARQETFNPTASVIRPLQGEAGTFLLNITKAGRLFRKIDLVEGGKQATGFGRRWKQFGIILSGSQLMFFKDVARFDSKMADFRDTESSVKCPVLKPDVILMTADSVALYDNSYTKRSNAFRLVCSKGYQYLFQAESEQEMNDWITKINYAATFKTAGIKMRHLRNSNREKGRQRRWERKNNIQPFFDYQNGSHFEHGPSDTMSDTFGRSEVLKSKMEDLKGKITTHTSQLHQDIRSINNLAIMIPYKVATRDCITQTTITVSKRIRTTFLELSKLLCYHEILEKDLRATMKEDADCWVRSKKLVRRSTQNMKSESCQGTKSELFKYNTIRDSYPRSASSSSLPFLDLQSSKSTESHHTSSSDETTPEMYNHARNSSPTLSTKFKDEILSFADVTFEEVHDRDKEESSGECGEGSIEEFLSAEES